jgi:hypothetical protein
MKLDYERSKPNKIVVFDTTVENIAFFTKEIDSLHSNDPFCAPQRAEELVAVESMPLANKAPACAMRVISLTP